MKKFFVILVCLLINVFSLFPTVLANADTSAEEVVSVIRQDFTTEDKIGDEFDLEGEYTFSNGLHLNGGKITTAKKANYFLCYFKIKSENFSFHFGEETLNINLVDGKIEFGETVSEIVRNVEEKEAVLWRVEVINDTLTVGFKTIDESVDFIYKDVFEVKYVPVYCKIGVSSVLETVVESINVYPYDSNFIPEHHDYNEKEDSLPQRTQKPVKDGKNTLKIVLISVGTGVVLVGVGVGVGIAIVVKKRRKKIEK